MKLKTLLKNMLRFSFLTWF